MSKTLQNKKVRLVLLGMMLLLTTIGTTYAWWMVKTSATQTVTMGKLGVTMELSDPADSENYEPGLYMDQEGTITNKGSIPALVKVGNVSEVKKKYTRYDNFDDFDAIAEGDQAYVVDPNGVKLKFGTPDEDAEYGISDVFTDGDDYGWLKDINGNIYLLLYDEGTAAPIATALFFDGSMDNTYMDADVKMAVQLEASQVLNDAVAANFGVDFDDFEMMDNKPNAKARTSAGNTNKTMQKFAELMNR